MIDFKKRPEGPALPKETKTFKFGVTANTNKKPEERAAELKALWRRHIGIMEDFTIQIVRTEVTISVKMTSQTDVEKVATAFVQNCTNAGILILSNVSVTINFNVSVEEPSSEAKAA